MMEYFSSIKGVKYWCILHVCVFITETLYWVEETRHLLCDFVYIKHHIGNAYSYREWVLGSADGGGWRGCLVGSCSQLVCRLETSRSSIMGSPNSGGSLFTVAIVSFATYKYNPWPTPAAVPPPPSLTSGALILAEPGEVSIWVCSWRAQLSVP